MEATRVIAIYSLLDEHGIEAWLQGGWGIDALLGRQTRDHKDLDLLVTVDKVVPLTALLDRYGFRLKSYWPENRWVWEGDARLATAFVLSDRAGNELDLHAMRFKEDGVGAPAWQSDRVFQPEDLAGVGRVRGRAVRCYSPEMQVRTHRGYELPEEQAQDLRLLHEELGANIAGLS